MFLDVNTYVKRNFVWKNNYYFANTNNWDYITCLRQPRL